MKIKQSNYAIVLEKIGGEFYPDPIYNDIQRLDKKLQYLNDYREKNNMKKVIYIAELLTKEREAQHNDEWTRWVASID